MFSSRIQTARRSSIDKTEQREVGPNFEWKEFLLTSKERRQIGQSLFCQRAICRLWLCMIHVKMPRVAALRGWFVRLGEHRLAWWSLAKENSCSTVSGSGDRIASGELLLSDRARPDAQWTIDAVEKRVSFFSFNWISKQEKISNCEKATVAKTQPTNTINQEN